MSAVTVKMILNLKAGANKQIIQKSYKIADSLNIYGEKKKAQNNNKSLRASCLPASA